MKLSEAKKCFFYFNAPFFLTMDISEKQYFENTLVCLFMVDISFKRNFPLLIFGRKEKLIDLNN